MAAQITVNIGVPGLGGSGTTSGDGGQQPSAAPSSGASSAGSNLMANDLPSPLDSGGGSGGGVMREDTSMSSATTADLPSPLHGIGREGATEAAAQSSTGMGGTLPSPLDEMSGAAVGTATSGSGGADSGLPSPFDQGDTYSGASGGDLPAPEAMNGAHGDRAGDAGLPRPSDRGHLGEHAEAMSGSADLPVPRSMEEIQADASRASQGRFEAEGHGPRPGGDDTRSGPAGEQEGYSGEGGSDPERSSGRRGRKTS